MDFHRPEDETTAVRAVTYAETDIELSAERIGTVDPDAFEPYVFGVGMDDWLALAND